MKQITVAFLAVLIAACSDDDVKLPPHTVENIQIVDGRRIQIAVREDITQAQCRALIAKFRSEAKPEGQVSVHKPCGPSKLAPWCVDNFDGRGVTFNAGPYYNKADGSVAACWR